MPSQRNEDNVSDMFYNFSDLTLRFKFKNFQGLGSYITEVNRLHEEEDVYFWAVLIRNATGDFFTPVGQ